MADNAAFEGSDEEEDYVTMSKREESPAGSQTAENGDEPEGLDSQYASMYASSSDKSKTNTDLTGGMDNSGFDAESGSRAQSEIDGPIKTSLDVKEVVPDGPHAGMGKEAVMQYSNTPFWRSLRWTLLILLVAGWLALLGASIGIIATSPRCLPWWQSSVIYQIYPRSFLDGNQSTGEGIGDFAGITEKLEYISGLGVGAILLNSIYKSPDKDFGYDVSNLTDVNKNFGTLEDFEKLVEKAHDLGLKVILDFVPNQASIANELFEWSRDQQEGWEDAFTWSDDVPNNWLSVYGNSSWSRDAESSKYYLHQFSSYQPDMNLNNEKVLEYLEDAMDFWFSKGVDGLNIQGTQYLFEDPDLRDEPVIDDFPGGVDEYGSLKHDYTVSYSGVHELLNDWREGIFFRFSTAGTYRLMITDANTNTTDQGNYYGSGDNPEADFPQNYNLFSIGNPNGDGGSTTGSEIDGLVENWINKIPNGKWPSFQLGNHEARRIASRLSFGHAKAANMLLLTLPGTPICYYGDEIGMSDTHIDTFDDVKDIKAKNDQDNWQTLTRDPERGPMQWNDSANAGFSRENPWLPVANNYQSVNVELQSDSEFSTLGVFKRTVAFRSDNRAFLSKDIQILEHEEQVAAYIRSSDDQDAKFLVIINFGSEYLESDIYNTNEGVSLQGTVRVATHSGREENRVELNKLGLAGGEGLIIQLD